MQTGMFAGGVMTGGELLALGIDPGAPGKAAGCLLGLEPRRVFRLDRRLSPCDSPAQGLRGSVS